MHMPIDPATALVVIDLQRGGVARNCGLSPSAHEFAIRTIFPRIGRIISTEDLQ